MRTNEKFIKTPVWLFEDEYGGLSSDAKLLYILLLDRVSLSEKNKFYNEKGEVYIHYKRKQASEKLGVSLNKVTQLFQELKKFSLIKEKRQGQGKSNIVVVLNPKISESRIAKSVNQESQNLGFSYKYNKTENNKTENQSVNQKTDGQTDEVFLEKIKQNCELEIFSDDVAAMFQNAIERIYYSEKLNVCGATLPQRKLRSLLCGLTAEALIHVFDNLNGGQLEIKRPIPYVMSAIINAIAESSIEEMTLH